MPFEIVRNDIANMCVDAIVNSANPRPVIGSGTDAGIHTKAGPELLAARKKIGDIKAGCSAITAGYGLDAEYVIHTVGPVWRGGLFGEAKLLRSCYDSALKLALEQGCRSVAFPLISTGNYGFPKDKALQIAISAFSEFLLEHEMQICLVVFDQGAYKLSERLFHRVASYIDQNYVDRQEIAEYAPTFRPSMDRREENRDIVCSRAVREREESMEPRKKRLSGLAMPTVQAPRAPKAMSLKDMLDRMDAGFSETLLKLIDRTGKKDSEIYKRANLSKQHFSKIRNNPDYKPTKATAIALALALELDLEQTQDLIGRAGYTLTKSSKFDLIIRYFIEQKNYNVVEINIALYEFDESLLGS